jgi:dUTP pyrophosphatase
MAQSFLVKTFMKSSGLSSKSWYSGFMSKTLKIIRMRESVPMPKYDLPGDAGFGLYVGERITLAPMERAALNTGYKMEIPKGCTGIIYERSGLSFKHGIITYGNVIDSGYRGEVRVGVMNLGKDAYTFEPGHKIAQMIIHKFETVKFKEVREGELARSDRGERGFGSTGK